MGHLPTPGLVILMPDAGREAPGVSIIEGPPCSWGIPRYSPRSLLVHLHSGPKPPFCPMMHQATRANYPPKGPGRVLPEIKFGGGKCGKEKWRAGRCWQSSATIRHGPFHRPSSADLELPRGPRAGSTAAGPRAVRATSSYPQQPAGPRGQTGAPPRGPRADPPPLSLELAATSDGVVIAHSLWATSRAPRPDRRSRSQRSPANAGLPALVLLPKKGGTA